MNDFLKPSKPYKKININGEQIKVEIVDKVPQEYTYVKEYEGMGLFILKTLFGTKDKYLLCKKNIANGQQNIK